MLRLFCKLLLKVSRQAYGAALLLCDQTTTKLEHTNARCVLAKVAGVLRRRGCSCYFRKPGELQAHLRLSKTCTEAKRIQDQLFKTA